MALFRIVFMGTSSFGLPCLDYICRRNDVEVSAVVTKSLRPSGRGRVLRDTPVKMAAMDNGLEILEPEDIGAEDFVRKLAGLKPDLNIVVAFGKILPKSVIDIPEYGSVNIHASLLPHYRGPSPINWAIINGEKETGVTSFFMEEDMDTGPVISQMSVPIRYEDDSGKLESRLKGLAVDVLKDTLDKIKSSHFTVIPQDERRASYAPKITPPICKIDWSWSCDRIYNLIRGLSPRPGAYSFFKNGRFINGQEDGAIFVKIWKVDSIPGDLTGTPGVVMGVGPGGIKVFSGKGILKIKEIQPAGKKKMDGRSFWSGYGKDSSINISS